MLRGISSAQDCSGRRQPVVSYWVVVFLAPSEPLRCIVKTKASVREHIASLQMGHTIQDECVDNMILPVAVKCHERPRKRSCRPLASDDLRSPCLVKNMIRRIKANVKDDRGRACVWLYTDSLVTWSRQLMLNITRRQLSWKVLSLSHVQWFS